MLNIYKEMKRVYPELDFRFHDDINVYEYHKDGEVMRYLTVPDQMASSDDELYSKVMGTIRKAGLKKVDFIFSHTEYEEALRYPAVGVKSTALWSNLVNYYVVNGHIHYHSIRDSVITTGALNFMTHGDDEVKGGVVITLKNFIHSYKFIPTKHFTKFKTLSITQGDYQPIVESIKKLFEFENSVYYIRVIGDLPQESMNVLREMKPLMRLKSIKERVKPQKSIAEETIKKFKFKPLEINKGNVVNLVKEDLGGFLTDEVLKTLEDSIKQLEV